ncbi:MAG: molybdate ABC transporter substrate-binding protein [Persephonella sp.]|nr:molybdate ABC transporter substrate-binding protein [Persephonella sp.]
MKNIPLREKGMNILLEDYINKVSVPNPRNAPYGEEAVRAMKKSGIYSRVLRKLVYGESVSQSTQYIYKRLVDVGFTSRSVVLSPQMRGKGIWIEVNPELYKPIRQGVVILKNGKNNPYVEEFVKLIFSKKGRDILKKYGYKTGE